MTTINPHQAPYGFFQVGPDSDGFHRIVENPEEIAVIRWLYDEASRTATIRSLADKLTDNNAPCRIVQKWTPSIVLKILRNAAYVDSGVVASEQFRRVQARLNNI